MHSKREQLGIDCLWYTVDICAIQEIKTVEPGVCTLSNSYRLIWFEQKDGRHSGLGFVISPRMFDYVVCCYMDLELPSRSGNLIT